MGATASREYPTLAVTATRGVRVGLPDSPANPPRNSHSSTSSSTIPSPRSEPDLRSDIHRSPLPNGLSPIKHSSHQNPLPSLTAVSSHPSLSDFNITASPEPREDILVPSLFTWNFGGHHVYVAGAWDHWQKKTPLDKCANEHVALIYIPCGEYQFKYYVDDNWQCAPNLPTRTDPNGNTNNIVKIAPAHLEYDSPTPIDQSAPPSPLATYDQGSTAEFSSDPPLLPPHLEARALKPLPDDISPTVAAVNLNPSPPRTPQTPRPALPGIPPTGPPDRSERPFFSHVFIDHLYKAQSVMDDEQVQCFSQTSRIHGKVFSMKSSLYGSLTTGCDALQLSPRVPVPPVPSRYTVQVRFVRQQLIADQRHEHLEILVLHLNRMPNQQKFFECIMNMCDMPSFCRTSFRA